MNAQELRDLTKDELEQKFRDFKSEFFNLRFQAAIGQLTNTARIKQVKRTIARINTIMKAHEIKEIET